VTTTAVRRLVLLRHAKAEPGGTVPDVLRPLALKGRSQASAVGRSLAAAEVLPEVVLCSDAVRTRQTWDLVRPGLGDVEPEVTVTADLYTADVAQVLALVAAVDDRVRTVLVVGHEPIMSSVAEHLAGADSDSAALRQVQVGVPTASYSVVESDVPWDAWGRRTGTLVRLVRAAD
jgi:phosphohistidine phosphatase